ncbi:hypothetical protein QE152_g7081 [Popillia japonica]|uniref:Uncharacterized protein n=1 Tax=Popillia japonica TaxID=7064 RepID=A0AAW1MGT7_POPJA
MEDQAAKEDDDDELPLVNYETIDQAVATTAAVSGEDILNAVRINEDEDSDQEEFDPEPKPIPTPQEALKAAKISHKFFTHHKDGPVATEDVLRLQDKIRSLLWKTMLYTHLSL